MATKHRKLKYLAHFAPGRGGQEVLAATEEEAWKKAEAAARRLGTNLHDVTGPDEDE